MRHMPRRLQAQSIRLHGSIHFTFWAETCHPNTIPSYGHVSPFQTAILYAHATMAE